MAKEKYIDIPAIVQLIGGVYLNNSVLDNSHYFFDEDDFTERFHKILFGTIYNLHNLGVTKIDIIAIEDYLQQRPEAYGVYQSNKGREYIQKLEENTQVAAFDYYYGRVKKMTLFRMYEKAGINLSWLYDIDNILDTKKKQAQEDWLDSHSLEEIADIIDSRIS
jgi:replicative DNA helicase